jgi:hypothetical protein
MPQKMNVDRSRMTHEEIDQSRGARLPRVKSFLAGKTGRVS